MKLNASFAIALIAIFCSAENVISQDIGHNSTDSVKLHKKEIVQEILLLVDRGVTGRDKVVHIESRKIDELDAVPDRMAGLISNIPGVYQASEGSAVSKPVIRGMQGMRVVTYWNGLRIENQQWGRDHGMAIGTLGIGLVDIRKGPASVIYGADALGGVVYFNDKPFVRSGTQKLEVETGVESATLSSISSLDYKVSHKSLRLNVAGSYSNYADYQLPNGNFVENSRFNEGAGKFVLAWSRRRWSAKVNYLFIRNRIGIPSYENAPEELEVTQQLRTASFPTQLIDNHFVSFRNRWINNRHRVKFLLGQTVNQLKKLEEVDEITFNTILANSLYHLKWQYEIGGGFNLVSGVQGGIQFNRNGVVDDEFQIPDFNQMDHGFYSVLSSKFRTGIDTWKIQAGLRYDNRSLEAFESQLAGTFKRNYQSVNGSIGLDWSVGPLSLIGNISTGFRSPHVRELTANGAQFGALRYEIGNPDLISERATQFDGVLEISIEDHLEFVINPFVNYVQNYIYASPTDSVIDDLPVFEYDQLAEVFLYGMDVGVNYQPQFANWLQWESSYSHIVGEAWNGDDLPLMPQNRLSNSFKFKLKDLIKGKFQFENLVLRHSAFFAQNRVSFDETPSNFYQLFDLGLNMKLKTKQPLEFGLGVRNLLNEGYIDHMSRLKNIGVQQTGRNVYFRMKFTLNYRFKKTTMHDVLILEEGR